jgi:hypothetical protein
MKCANKYVNGFVYAKLESIFETWNNKKYNIIILKLYVGLLFDKVKNNELTLFLFIELCHWSLHQSITQESFSKSFLICLSWSHLFFFTLTYMMTNEALQKGWKLRIIDEKYMFMDEKLNNEK